MACSHGGGCDDFGLCHLNHAGITSSSISTPPPFFWVSFGLGKHLRQDLKAGVKQQLCVCVLPSEDQFAAPGTGSVLGIVADLPVPLLLGARPDCELPSLLSQLLLRLLQARTPR